MRANYQPRPTEPVGRSLSKQTWKITWKQAHKHGSRLPAPGSRRASDGGTKFLLLLRSHRPNSFHTSGGCRGARRSASVTALTERASADRRLLCLDEVVSQGDARTNTQWKRYRRMWEAAAAASRSSANLQREAQTSRKGTSQVGSGRTPLRFSLSRATKIKSSRRVSKNRRGRSVCLCVKARHFTTLTLKNPSKGMNHLASPAAGLAVGDSAAWTRNLSLSPP